MPEALAKEKSMAGKIELANLAPETSFVLSAVSLRRGAKGLAQESKRPVYVMEEQGFFVMGKRSDGAITFSPVGDPQEDILRGAIILARPDSLMLAKTKLRPDTVIEFARVPQREIRTAQPMAFQLMVPRGIQNVRGSVVNYSTSVSRVSLRKI